MLEFLAAGTLALNLDPVTADCTVTGGLGPRRASNISMACPDNVEAFESLQQAANAAIERLNLPYRIRSEHVSLARSVTFTRIDSRWAIVEPVALVRVTPQYAVRAAEVGIEGRCDLRGLANDRGCVEQLEVQCRTFQGRGRQVESNVFDRTAERAATRSLWLIDPGQPEQCFTVAYTFQLGSAPQGDEPWLDVPADAPRCDRQGEAEAP